MKYVIIINNSPLNSQASLTAYHFAETTIQKKHQLLSVFFYQQGAYHGLTHTVLQQDETDVSQLWVTLTNSHYCPLHICSAAALRRGIIDTTAAKHYQLPISMNKNFQAISLNEFLLIAADADRMLNFA